MHIHSPRWLLVFSLVTVMMYASICRAQPDGAGPPSPTRGATTSPFDPPPADDHTFVVNSGTGLDTGCTYRSHGPLLITIPVTRYLGPTNADGTLRDARALIDAGLLSRYATLIMPAWDIDEHGVCGTGCEPERDFVFFNDQPVKSLCSTNDQYLRGNGGDWKLNSFKIPIDKVRFPHERGSNGVIPTPEYNVVRIDIDQANLGGGEPWCCAIDWVALSFKAMSPVILIHGNSMDGSWFVRQGFTAGLDARHLLWDNSISLTPSASPRSDNATKLDARILPIVKSFGVDSVHLVAHSKGGLDAREYIALYQPKYFAANTPPPAYPFSILSLTTLSTPHNGSVLADVVTSARKGIATVAQQRWHEFPGFAHTLIALTTPNDGYDDLRTDRCALFNMNNVPSLWDSGAFYNAIAGDLDQNGNARVDAFPVYEYLELTQDDWRLLEANIFSPSQAAALTDVPYQIVRGTASIQVHLFLRERFDGTLVLTADITSIPAPGAVGNDVLVSIPSGLGQGTIGPSMWNTRTFTGLDARNHSSIGNAGITDTVAPWLYQIERITGDLR
jgi:pimeloyl-ACP methyl ester carboxylesterase